jgi:hypothetical protein
MWMRFQVKKNVASAPEKINIDMAPAPTVLQSIQTFSEKKGINTYRIYASWSHTVY